MGRVKQNTLSVTSVAHICRNPLADATMRRADMNVAFHPRGHFVRGGGVCYVGILCILGISNISKKKRIAGGLSVTETVTWQRTACP